VDFLNGEEKKQVRRYYLDAGLLDNRKRAYFKAHFSNTFRKAAGFLLAGKNNPRIIDLGSGYGTQALFFAFLGAEVISIDIDPLALRIQEKRIVYYENLSGQKLNIKLIQKDSFDVNYDILAPVDGFYSMFAFNMIQPSLTLLEMILPCISVTGKFVIQDGNSSSLLNRLLPSRKRDVLSPQELSQILDESGFEIYSHQGCICFPPLFWFILPNRLMELIERPFRKNWLYPISQQILAEKKFNS
jgi:SAM-dependent methyltransferase